MSIRRSALGLLLFAFCCTGVAVDWPSGSCAGTLQACVDANSTVDIVTDGPINEDININASRTLRAAPGYKPVFSAGRSVLAQINLGGASSATIRIEGLTMERGEIRILQLSGTVSAYIVRNTINDTVDGEGGIVLYPTVSDPFTAYVEFNQVDHTHTVPNPIVGGAISLTASNNTDATAQIYGNTIRAYGAGAFGIRVVNDGIGDVQADILGNTVMGGAVGSIYLQQANNSGAELVGRVVSNSVMPLPGEATPYGIGVHTQGADSDFSVFNNTVTHAQNGVRAIHDGGSQSGSVVNNLLAFNSVFGIAIDGGSSMTNRHNLVHGNAGNSYSPGVNTLSSDPALLAAGANNRLSSSSPAIDSADSLVLFSLANLPNTDADGMFRLNGSDLDIGAYESGRHGKLHRASASSDSHISHLDAPWLNGQAGLTIFANPVYTEASLIDNPHPLGVYYASSTWRIFNQDFGEILPNAAFSVFHAGSNTVDFLHSHTGISNTTVIDRAGLNDEPNKILAVTQNWNGAGAGVYNPSQIGLVYLFGQWGISNLDLSDIPDGADFNVFYQDPSANAFEHIVTPGTKRFTTVSSEIDHPLLNGIECAQFTYTYSTSQGIFADNPFIAWYRSTRQRWHIAPSLDLLPDGAAFHIIVDPQQVADCTDVIFEDTLGGQE